MWGKRWLTWGDHTCHVFLRDDCVWLGFAFSVGFALLSITIPHIITSVSSDAPLSWTQSSYSAANPNYSPFVSSFLYFLSLALANGSWPLKQQIQFLLWLLTGLLTSDSVTLLYTTLCVYILQPLKSCQLDFHGSPTPTPTPPHTELNEMAS